MFIYNNCFCNWLLNSQLYFSFHLTTPFQSWKWIRKTKKSLQKMVSHWKTKAGLQTSIFYISSKRSTSGPIEKKFKRKWKNSTINDSKFTRRLFTTKKKPKRSSETILGEKPLKGRKETAEPLRKSLDSLIVLLAAKIMVLKDLFTNTSS